MNGGKETRVSIRTWNTHAHYPSALFAAMTRLTLKSCTGPTGLSSGRLVTGRADTKIRFYRGYHARLRATVTEFSSSLRSHPSLRPGQCGSRSWVALPPNKLSPPRHLHKSIKSVLVALLLPSSLSTDTRRVSAREKMFDRCSLRILGLVGRGGCLFFLFSFFVVFYIIFSCFELPRLVWLAKKVLFRPVI